MIYEEFTPVKGNFCSEPESIYKIDEEKCHCYYRQQ
jgi:hypothetical protein